MRKVRRENKYTDSQAFGSNSEIVFDLWLFFPMAASGPQHAKRALVKVLLTLAALYCLHVEVNRESGDQEVLKAFRRVK